jgi:carboxymethylenebutenolidase
MTYEGMLAETTMITGYNGQGISAYFARPLGPGPFPGLVLMHHLPGWDEWYREATRRFAHHGYLAISPNLYHREGPGDPEDIGAKVRAAGGVADEQAIGDGQGAINYLRSLSISNKKIGVFGTCSGGRHAYLLACRATGVDAIIDCWGGGVVMSKNQLNKKQPVAPLEYTRDLECPLLGIFGEDDPAPTPSQVAHHEQELIKYKKDYRFHTYPNAGHGFFYYHRPGYRAEQAVDGWEKIWAFLEKNLII